MTHHRLASILIVLASVWTTALTIASQPTADVTSPNGIALSEFKGYESWEVITPTLPKDGLKVIVGNPAMIRAYRDGLIASGKAVPDGAVMAKIVWTTKEHPLLPGAARVPDALTKIQFMVKDAKRFPDTDGWGYADFHYDAESASLRGVGNGPGFAKTACHQCHTRVKARDFVFTDYAGRLP